MKKIVTIDLIIKTINDDIAPEGEAKGVAIAVGIDLEAMAVVVADLNVHY